jgi:hypothetical protein
LFASEAVLGQSVVRWLPANSNRIIYLQRFAVITLCRGVRVHILLHSIHRLVCNKEMNIRHRGSEAVMTCTLFYDITPWSLLKSAAVSEAHIASNDTNSTVNGTMIY